jgi:hypothetical protein
MTRDEAIKDIRDNIKPVVGGVSLEMAIKALEQQTCEDAVSRQAVLDVIDDIDKTTCMNEYHVIVDAIDKLPSVNPQPKTGHWEWVRYDSNPNIGNWHCSECNRIVCGAITAANPVYAYKYCPDCGAKMIEPQESEDKE